MTTFNEHMNSSNIFWWSTISAIFKELKDTGVKYRNRVRSRISNLKDAKNPNLRISVLLGRITPERLAVLTSEVHIIVRHWLKQIQFLLTNF